MWEGKRRREVKGMIVKTTRARKTALSGLIRKIEIEIPSFTRYYGYAIDVEALEEKDGRRKGCVYRVWDV